MFDNDLAGNKSKYKLINLIECLNELLSKVLNQFFFVCEMVYF